MAARAKGTRPPGGARDRKSTRLNSSHANISYAVFCLKKKKSNHHPLEKLSPHYHNFFSSPRLIPPSFCPRINLHLPHLHLPLLLSFIFFTYACSHPYN